MGKTEKTVAISGFLVAVGGGAISPFASFVLPEYAKVGFWVGLVIFAIGTIMLGWAMLQEREHDAEMGDTYNNSGTNYGHMGPVHIGRQEFKLTQSHIHDLLGKMPRGRKIILQVVGNARAQEMGQSLGRALSQAGYEIENHQIGVLCPSPDSPLTALDKGSHIEITLAPSA